MINDLATTCTKAILYETLHKELSALHKRVKNLEEISNKVQDELNESEDQYRYVHAYGKLRGILEAETFIVNMDIESALSICDQMLNTQCEKEQ